MGELTKKVKDTFKGAKDTVTGGMRVKPELQPLAIH
jgi:hypothetical protein